MPLSSAAFQIIIHRLTQHRHHTPPTPPTPPLLRREDNGDPKHVRNVAHHSPSMTSAPSSFIARIATCKASSFLALDLRVRCAFASEPRNALSATSGIVEPGLTSPDRSAPKPNSQPSAEFLLRKQDLGSRLCECGRGEDHAGPRTAFRGNRQFMSRAFLQQHPSQSHRAGSKRRHGKAAMVMIWST